jgi:CRP-like cAMP-binding protein
MEEKLALLQRAPVFSQVATDVLEQIARVAEERDVPPGTVLTHEGRHEGFFFLVVSGGVVIERGGDTLRALGPGDFLGSIALLDGGPRTATATTSEPTRLLTLRVEDFHALLDASTDARDAILGAVESNLKALDT